MKTTLTTENLAETIYENHYPENFKCPTGVDETHFQASYKGANASVREIFFDGVIIRYGKYSFEDTFIVKGGFDEPIIEAHFNLKGRTVGKVPELHGDLIVEEGEHNLVYLNEPTGIMHFEKNADILCLEVSFTPRYFQRFENQKSKIIELILQSIEKEHPVRMPENGKVNPAMKRAIDQIVSSHFHDTTKRLMIESGVLELLAHQLEIFTPQIAPDKSHLILHPKDRDKLYYAREILIERIETPPTIFELSKLIGMNEFKLKKEFKSLFGNTVFGYLSDHRLGLARRYLLDTDMTIAQISEKIGYSYPQHFSTAFKRKFGVSPNRIRS